jgi:hypothetical protein
MKIENIPQDLDEKLKIKAARAKMRFSEVTILAFSNSVIFNYIDLDLM